MSDDALAGASEPDPRADTERSGGGESETTDADDSTVRRYLDYVLLAGFLLLGAVAAISLYLSASQVISDWVAPEYQSLFRTAFNLVVLLVVGVGISRELRRLR